MSERIPYELEKIPDFAMRPAREKQSEEQSSAFDPELYERLLAGLELFEPAAIAPAEVPEVSETVETAPAEVPEASAMMQEAPDESYSTPEPAETAPAETSASEPSEIRGTILPVTEGVILNRLNLVEMVPCEPVKIRIEEDILVPDVKPDLESILSMDGKLQVTEQEGILNGDLILQTLYVPQGKGADRAVVDMEARIAFRHEMPGTGCQGRKVDVKIDALEHSVVNERKYRIRATVMAEERQYRNREMELFGGLKDEEVQLLQETVTMTDVALRKTELLELEEDLPLPDSLPEPQTILRCDVTLAENHKQINRDKAVVSGTAHYTILYLPKEETEPVLFQAKSDFTQFLPLERGGQNDLSAGRIFFRCQKITAEPKENDGGVKNSIHVKMEGDTFLELYREVERRVVTDAYHHQKELVFDTEAAELMQLNLCGIGETTVREVVSIPEQIGGVKAVMFLSGNLKGVKSKIEGGKNVVEGQVEARLVCLSDEESSTPFDMVRQIPFRVSMDLPSGISGFAGTSAATASPLTVAPLPDNCVILKELRCDRLNDRQIELNAVVQVNGAVIRKKKCPLLHNLGFVEESGPQKERPGLVLYISRPGDTLWKIARKYRTTIDAVAKINGFETQGMKEDRGLEPGTKLLIVK